MAATSVTTSEIDTDWWVRWSARLGFTAKGIVYGIVGILAVQAAIYARQPTAGPTTAIRTIAQQEFGTILLISVAVGLVAYVVWRFIQAIADVERKGTSAKGLLIRSGYAMSGLAHVFIAWSALSMVFGWGTRGEGVQEREWTAWLMSFPLGQWLVAIVGASIIGIGIGQLVMAYRCGFIKLYKTHEMTPLQRKASLFAGRFGQGARGLVFCLIGVFFISAAVQSDASRAAGLSGALTMLAQQAHGPWLLGTVALGLVAYGIFCFTQARFRSFA